LIIAVARVNYRIEFYTGTDFVGTNRLFRSDKVTNERGGEVVPNIVDVGDEIRRVRWGAAPTF